MSFVIIDESNVDLYRKEFIPLYGDLLKAYNHAQEVVRVQQKRIVELEELIESHAILNREG